MVERWAENPKVVSSILTLNNLFLGLLTFITLTHISALDYFFKSCFYPSLYFYLVIFFLLYLIIFCFKKNFVTQYFLNIFYFAGFFKAYKISILYFFKKLRKYFLLDTFFLKKFYYLFINLLSTLQNTFSF